MISQEDIQIFKHFQRSPIFFINKMWRLEPTPLREEYIIHYYKDRNFKKYFWDNDIKRDNKILVKVVKELKEEANGKRAELKIVRIPADVDMKLRNMTG